jgi:hypothetical protein
MTATAETPEDARFVLPHDAPFVRNLAALWSIDPRLARAIEALPEDGCFRLVPSRSGPFTVAVNVDGHELFLHSRHHPIDEAARLIDGIDFGRHAAFFIQGFGLGYHVEATFEKASEEAILCVSEPDLRMLRTALQARDLTPLIESRRVHFFWQADKSELFMRLQGQAALFTLGCETVSHGPSIRLNEAHHRQAAEWMDEFVAYSRTSINTLVLNGRRTAENVARNIGWYAATPSLSHLKDRHKGQPAIIVSAGPSLRKNGQLLKGLADKAVIIAVQTTLQPLLEMGIEPHYVTSLDYHDICTRFFEKLPPNLRTELVAEPKATPLIFGMNPGPLSLLGNDFAEGLLREMKLGKTKLTSGATVAHLAYYLAEHLGCDPIVFIGQDLGFSDGLCYAPGTSYEDVWRPELSRFCTVEMKQWEQIARDRRILRRIPDHHGRPMYTEERLFMYLQQFERDFLRTSTRIIDATEGGARKRGTEVMTLADAISRFMGAEALTPAAGEHPGLRWDRLEECAACLSRRCVEAREIEQISRQTLALLEEASVSLQDQPRVNRAIARIDVLRQRMNALGATYDLIMQLSQLTELKRFHADRHITAARGLDEAERQRRQVARDIENVQGVIDAAVEFQNLMDDVRARLSIQHAAAPVRGLAA